MSSFWTPFGRNLAMGGVQRGTNLVEVAVEQVRVSLQRHMGVLMSQHPANGQHVGPRADRK